VFDKLNEIIQTGLGMRFITHVTGAELIGHMTSCTRKWIARNIGRDPQKQQFEVEVDFKLTSVGGESSGW
jgi:hypothetical protein